jgi:hypothetical protein
MLPTTRSSLINCNYFIEVHIYHRGLTFKSKVPPAVVPIVFYPHINKKPTTENPPTPLNWNPKIFSQLKVKGEEPL